MGYGMQGNNIPSGYKAGRIQNYTPEQMKLFKGLFSHVAPGSYTARLAGGDESLFNQIEQGAMKQFGEFQGQNASRFSANGMGNRHGSAFQNSNSQASADFASQLQQQRHGLQQQAIQGLMGMSNTLLNQRPYENFLTQKQHQPSFLDNLIGGGAPLVGAGIGGFFGGPAGAAFGAQLGGAAGQGFTGGGYQGQQNTQGWRSF